MKVPVITVVGAGGWGTTLAKLLFEKGNMVKLYTPITDLAESIREFNENKDFLPGVILSEDMIVTSDPEYAFSHIELAVIAVPSRYLKGTIIKLKEFIKDDIYILSAVKGLFLCDDRLLTVTQFLKKLLPELKEFAALSGPNLAFEVARRIPTSTVVAAKSFEVARYIQSIFMTDYFRVYTGTDVTGVELGGALKNIVAIASGISDGLGYGSNTKSSLITRGLVEIIRLGTFLQANKETFSGLSGLGDLVATCTSQLSRNWQIGYRLGKGESISEIVNSMKMVAEGVTIVKDVYDFAKANSIMMPITEKVYNIIYGGLKCQDAVYQLMERAPKPEFPY